MKHIIFILLIALPLTAAKSDISLQYTSLTHRYSPQNHFLSLYINTEDIYSFQSGDLELRVGLSALGVLDRSDDFTLFDTIDKNRALIHSLSLDYYPNPNTLLSIGRQSLDINLIRGSFDGILGVANFDDFSIKGFYFKHYALLDSAYYKSAEIDKLFGFNFNYDKGILESEITHFDYYGHHVNNAYIALHPVDFTIGAEYLSFTSDILDDEKAYKFNLGYKYENLYLEIGYSYVYEGTLRNIFALGGSEFKNYQLQGFLDQKEAKKTYISLKYKDNDFRASLYYGQAKFEAFWNPNEKYTGKEFGITLAKQYDDLELSAALLSQKSDELWDLGERTTWIHTSMKYRF